MNLEGSRVVAKNPSKYIALTAYCLVFFLVWTIFELLIKPGITLQILKQGIKVLVWTLPALLLVWKNPGFVGIGLREMFAAKVRWRRYIWVFALFAAYILGGAYLMKGNLSLSESFSADSILIVLFVGITEEMVFRGWLLNATVSGKSKIPAVSINALMFLAIHFPRWIAEDSFSINFTNLEFLGIIALSVIFSLSFIKSRNILVPIGLHMFWDLLAFLFF
jgi:membrane protease YdiL (CAAX protease family)